MSADKTVKLSRKNHKRLQQYKLDNDLKSIDQAIAALLKVNA
jgi:hypothetical protein